MACAETALALSLTVSTLLNMVLLFTNLAENQTVSTNENTAPLLEVATETPNTENSPVESTA